MWQFLMFPTFAAAVLIPKDCGDDNLCGQLPWSEWSPCSQTCGGGSQARKREICGLPEWTEGDIEDQCKKPLRTDHRTCNMRCLHGGTFADDRCICTAGKTGRCCEIDTYMKEPFTSKEKASAFIQRFPSRVKRMLDLDINEECRESKGCYHEEVREYLAYYKLGNDVCGWMKNRLCNQRNCGAGYYCVTTDSNGCTNLNNYHVGCQDINECASSPCHHGSCVNLHNRFTCSCPDIYYGRLCENTCVKPDHCATYTCTTRNDYVCTKCIDQGFDAAHSIYIVSPTQKTCEATCSWKQNWCWPGTCRGYLAKNCACDDGFSLSSRDSTKICNLNISSTLLTCRLGVENKGGEVKNSTSTGPCLKEKSNFMKFQPAYSSFVFEFVMNVPVSRTKPNRIYDYSFGVVKSSVSVSKRNIHRIRTQLKVLEPHQSKKCTFNEFNNTDPFPTVITCKMNVQTPWNFLDGERFCFEYTSYGGGYLRTKDFSGNVSPHHIYHPTKASHEVCMTYDSSAPKHCSENSSCLHNETIIIDDPVTKTRSLSVSLRGWFDSYPLFPNQASGIDGYILTIHETVEIDSSTLAMDEKSLLTYNVTSGINVIQLPDKQPALYGLRLDVADKAGNSRLARRFVLFDNSSKIFINHVYKLTVSSGNPATNFTWQINHGEICVNWVGRYYNSFNVHNNLLRKIKPDFHNLYRSVYEQLEGKLPVSGTPNINGIIEFLYVVNRKKEMLLNNSATNIFNQSFCHLLDSKDGETYNITVTAVDIIGNRLSESVIIRIDSSRPEIYFVKDGTRQSSENVTNSPKLTLEILDEHSGLYFINWTLGTSAGGGDLGDGNLPIQLQSQHSCDRSSRCYCPETGKCENYSYSFNIFDYGLKNFDENHNANYFLTIYAMNHAHLLSTLTIEMKVKKCLSNTCLHGGTCLMLNSDYKCSCPKTHYGSRCQYACIRPTHCEEYECTSAADYVCKKCYGQGATPEKSAYFPSSNQKSCTDFIPPQFINCPSSMMQKYDSGEEGSYVTWEPIHAQDNARNFTLTSNIKNGDFLSFGDHFVTYNATDDSGNVNTCSFAVKVAKIKDKTCESPPLPFYGVLRCQDNKALQCSIDSCNAGYLLRNNLTYTCKKGLWAPEFRNDFITTSCIKPEPTYLRRNYTFTFNCPNLKFDAVELRDCIKQSGLCPSGDILLCDRPFQRIEGQQLSYRKLQIWMIMEGKLPYGVQKQQMIQQIDTHGQKIIDLFQTGTFVTTCSSLTCDFGDIKAEPLQEVCEAGSVFYKVNGQEVCAKCGPGSFFKHNMCVLCSKGFYQDQLGQKFCKKCPDGRTSKQGTFLISQCYVEVIVEKQLSPLNTLTMVGVTVGGLLLIMLLIILIVIHKWRKSSTKDQGRRKNDQYPNPTYDDSEVYDEIPENEVSNHSRYKPGPKVGSNGYETLPAKRSNDNLYSRMNWRAY